MVLEPVDVRKKETNIFDSVEQVGCIHTLGDDVSVALWVLITWNCTSFNYRRFLTSVMCQPTSQNIRNTKNHCCYVERDDYRCQPIAPILTEIVYTLLKCLPIVAPRKTLCFVFINRLCISFIITQHNFNT